MKEANIYDSLEVWKNREQNIARLFGSDVLDRPIFLQEKLKHYRSLRTEAVLHGNRNDLAFKLLKNEIRLLERRLYPRVSMRLLNRTVASLSEYFGNARLRHFENQRLLREKTDQGIIDALTKPPLVNAQRNTVNDTVIGYRNTIKKQNILHQKTTDMNENNYDFLSRQLFFTGFGDAIKSDLKEKMPEGKPDFTLEHKKDFGNDATSSLLYFKKSTDSDFYFFNKYSVSLHNSQFPDPIKQTYFVNKNQDTISLKEGYNLLAGRSVYKEMATREGEKYKAWVTLDFKQVDANGNFKMNSYGERYGFDLQSALGKHKIIELGDPAKRGYLIESLERGNRQGVSIEINGQEKRMMIEAAPRFKSLNIYELNGVRVKAGQLNAPANIKQETKQSTGLAKAEASIKNDQTKANNKTLSASAASDQETPGELVKKRSRKNRQSIR